MRREDLHSPASSRQSSPDPELENLLRSRAHDEFAFTLAENSVADTQHATNSDDDEIELRLFATPSNAAATTHKIRLSSPRAVNVDPGFTVKKPRSYYFADEPTGHQQEALRTVAVDGRTVLELSRNPWPGCALPWKVTRISAAGVRREILVGHPPSLQTVEQTTKRRTRKGKKTRIAIRKKRAAVKDKREEQARLAKEKEEAEREKRTRRNREKKVKKKAREKAKKMEGAIEGTSSEQVAAAPDAASD